MTRNELLRSMIRALADVKEEGNRYEMSEQWDVTAHMGRQRSTVTVQHVVRITLEPEFVVIETRKGHRYVVLDDEVHTLAQEPSERESRGGRRAGF